MDAFVSSFWMSFVCVPDDFDALYTADDCCPSVSRFHCVANDPTRKTNVAEGKKCINYVFLSSLYFLFFYNCSIHILTSWRTQILAIIITLHFLPSSRQHASFIRCARASPALSNFERVFQISLSSLRNEQIVRGINICQAKIRYLFKPYFCFLIWTISDISLFLQ